MPPKNTSSANSPTGERGPIEEAEARIQDANVPIQVGLENMMENASSNEAGTRRLVQVLIDNKFANQYKKVLSPLQKYQSMNQGRKYTWPQPTNTKEIQRLIKQHKAHLTYDKQSINRNRLGQCMVRDLYKSSDLSRMLKTIWKNGTIREQFTISARHYLILQDRDIRSLNLSDMFTTIMDRE
ncbi:hypothetical protein BD408DRAFT_436934 [Parasitella parasitica]|nr:hypothetical protein BD408DRAFT_436934 [Parasitella parasitica]